MLLLLFFIGFIIGALFIIIINKTKKIYGVIDVDSRTGLCRVHISSEELGNSNAKHAIFTVNHNANLNADLDDSRDEPLL